MEKITNYVGNIWEEYYKLKDPNSRKYHEREMCLYVYR